MGRDIDDDFDSNFELENGIDDADDALIDEEKEKTKSIEKRLKIDALLESQRLKKLQQALDDEDDFAEFEKEL